MTARELLQGIDRSAPRARGIRVDGAPQAGTHRDIASPIADPGHFTGVMRQAMQASRAPASPREGTPEASRRPQAEGAELSDAAASRPPIPSAPSADGMTMDGLPARPEEASTSDGAAPMPIDASTTGTDASQSVEADSAAGASEVTEVPDAESDEAAVEEELTELFGRLREYLTLLMSGGSPGQLQGALLQVRQALETASSPAQAAIVSAAAGEAPEGMSAALGALARQVSELLGLVATRLGDGPLEDTVFSLAAGLLAGGPEAAAEPAGEGKAERSDVPRDEAVAPDPAADALLDAIDASGGEPLPDGAQLLQIPSSGGGTIPFQVVAAGQAAPAAPVAAEPGVPTAAAAPQPGVEARTAREAAGAPAPRAAQALPELVERLVRAAQMTLRDGATEMRLRLHPPHLGHLRVEMVVSDGVLTGRMQTDSAAAQLAVTAQVEQLKAALADQGITLGAWDVTVAPDAREGAASSDASGRDGTASGPEGDRDGGEDPGTGSDWRAERLRFGLSRFERVA